MGEVKLRVPFGLSSEDTIDAEKLDAMPSAERLELFGGLVDQVRELEQENRVWGDRGGWEQYGGQEDGSDV